MGCTYVGVVSARFQEKATTQYIFVRSDCLFGLLYLPQLAARERIVVAMRRSSFFLSVLEVQFCNKPSRTDVLAVLAEHVRGGREGRRL